MRYRKLEKGEPPEDGDLWVMAYQQRVDGELRASTWNLALNLRPLTDEPEAVAPESDEVRVEGTVNSEPTYWEDGETTVTIRFSPKVSLPAFEADTPVVIVFGQLGLKAPTCRYCGVTMRVEEDDDGFYVVCRNLECPVDVAGPCCPTRAEAIAAMTPKWG